MDDSAAIRALRIENGLGDARRVTRRLAHESESHTTTPSGSRASAYSARAHRSASIS